MTGPTPTTRRPHPTPACLILGLLVVEGLLWLSERYQWPTWHKGYAVLTAVATVGVVMIVMLGWFIVALVFRWRFQFSIRSLLVLVAAVALPCSWLTVKMKAAREQKTAVETINRLGGSVFYDYRKNFFWLPISHAQPPEPAWLRSLFGVDFFHDVRNLYFDNRLTGLVLKHLKDLPLLEELWLESSDISDDGLVSLEELQHLQLLRLDRSSVSAKGIERLQEALPNCKIDCL
jgi:hypothetical protein